MLRNLRKTIVSLLSAATLAVVPIAIPAAVHAAPNIKDCLIQGSNLTTDEECQDNQTNDAGTNINSLITKIINIFSFVVGVVAVIMIIVGGFKYISSGGDSNKITSAKNTIIYAIIGLVIVALAQIIVQFVLGKVTDSV